MFQDNVLVNLFRGNESVFPSLSNPHTELNSTNYFVAVPNLYNQTFLLHAPRGEEGGGRPTSHTGLYGKAPPERGPFSGFS